MTATTHEITLDYYSLDDIRDVVEKRPRLALSAEVKSKIAQGQEFVDAKSKEDRYIYGVNTGFGSLCETRIEAGEMERLQYNHVTSHSVGVGDPVPEHISRYVMLIKLLTFRSGRTGISVPLVERFIDFWNAGAIPAIPQKGSVGASGDLAPLAHMGLPLLGLGKVHYQGKIIDSADVLSEFGWKPATLKPKEGLAITNGIQYINALAAHALIEIREYIIAADVIASLSIQAFSASKTFYDLLYQSTSLHEDRTIVAQNLITLLEGSNHFELSTCNRSMQDPYSYRCVPQVHAAVRQTYRFARDVIEKDCNGVSDNPLFFPDEDKILFGGALHGESTAMVLDFLCIALSELANISERRTWQLLLGKRGLPDFLAPNPGLNSGMMITQYTSAALVNENKVFATPASIDTIPTCQDQEDHVSMGPTAAFKLDTIIKNCSYILGIELLNAAQAVDLNTELKLSSITHAIHSDYRSKVSFLESDRVLSNDIEESRKFLVHHKRSWTSEIGLR